MRIISQNKEFDVPYEQVTLIAEEAASGEKYYITAYAAAAKVIAVLGIFENRQKAIVELQNIRAKYAERWPVYEIGTERRW